MKEGEVEGIITSGITAAERGDTAFALTCLEKASSQQSSPLVSSYLAYCLAKEQRQFEKALSLCREAMEEEPAKSVHYLNLGRVYVLCGQKREAIKTFRNGLLFENNRLIRGELDRLGWRNPPVIAALKREHPLNKFLGMLLRKLQLR